MVNTLINCKYLDQPIRTRFRAVPQVGHYVLFMHKDTAGREVLHKSQVLQVAHYAIDPDIGDSIRPEILIEVTMPTVM